MGHFLLSSEATFSAAHTLPGVDMCERLHGHNWRVRLTIRVPDAALDDVGMGIDFREIERIASESVADLEHRYLNELDEFQEGPPTAERVSKLIHDRAASRLASLNGAASVEEVVLWELPEYRVVYRP
jgi:6-pyruvoyltetrahydropterin/6-carboxytetrahydropterin synthase